MFLYHYWVREPAMVMYFSHDLRVHQLGHFLLDGLVPVRLPPIITVCLGYSGCIATFILSATASSLGESSLWDFAIILHSASIMVLLRSVTIPPSTGNLSIPWTVDGTAWTFLRPERLMIPLYGNGDRATIKFLKEFVECFSSPKDTISDIGPNGQDISPLNPRSGVVAGII
ncbi:hypothetical protein Tco_1170359 [Tanacetum coccineum]